MRYWTCAVGVLDRVSDLQQQLDFSPVSPLLASLSRRDRDESLMLV
ncbi:hypothetical protein E3A20_21970, partial [Planctomyces bekefii]